MKINANSGTEGIRKENSLELKVSIIKRLREREREGDYRFLIFKKFRNEPFYKRCIVEDGKMDS